MATSNTENVKHEFSDQIIQFFSNNNDGTSQINNEDLLTLLAEMKDQLKDTEIRRGLEEYLFKFNLSLNRAKSVKNELTKSMISIATAGDTMVSVARKRNLFRLHNNNNNNNINENNANTENVQNEEAERRQLQIDMDSRVLTDQPDLCIEDLNILRNMIQECLVLHTELFLMGNEVHELIENVKLLNIIIPIYDGDNYNHDQIAFNHILIRGSHSVCVGMMLGGIAGLIGGGTISIVLLTSLQCHSCCYMIGHALLGLGCSMCTRSSLRVFGGAVLIVHLCATLGLLAGWAWDVGSERRKVLEGIYKFRDELEKSQLKTHLQGMVQKLKSFKEGAQNRLQEREGDAISPSQFNIIMKAYKEYRKSFERARSNPQFQTRSDAELHQIVRIGAINVIEPLEQSFNFSEEKCWELIDAIHGIVNRNYPE